MSFYALYGTGYNQLARMATAATPTDADSLFPIANLYNGQPWKPFRFGSSATSLTIDFDLNQVVNNEFETAFSGGVPGTGWSAVIGTLSRVNTAPHAGTYHLEVVSGGVGSHAEYTIEAVAGEVLSVSFYGRNNGAGTATALIYDMESGTYLQSNGTWTSTATSFYTNATSAYTQGAATFTVPSYSTGGSDRSTLVFWFGVGYWDSFIVYPRVNFVSIHGHNFAGAIESVVLKSDSTSPGATTRATMTLARPTMFSTFASVDNRYWRLLLANGATSGLNQTEVPWIGELVLGQYQTLTRRQNFGQELTLTHAQDRDSTDLGPFSAYVRQELGRRKASLQFRYNEDTDYEQAREIVERSKGGANPLVLVLESGDETTAMLGRLAPDWSHSRVTNTMRDASWEFEELPFPVIVP